MVENTDASLLAKLEELQIGDAAEWLCTKCHVIHPTQQARRVLQPCPDCGCAMLPSSQNRREIDRLKAELQSAADALRRSGEALRRLQEDIENIPTFDMCTKYRERVLELVMRQRGAEGTEAGGRSHPLAPIK